MKKIDKGLMTHRVIFALDNPMREVELINLIEHATDRKDAIKRCVGYYEGEHETSFVTDARLFELLVRPNGFTTNQECLMHVIGDEQRVLFQWQNHPTLNMEFMGYLSPYEGVPGPEVKGYTYDYVENTYFTITGEPYVKQSDEATRRKKTPSLLN